MSKKNGYYPSTRKGESKNNGGEAVNFFIDTPLVNLDLTTPFKVKDEAVNNTFKSWAKDFSDNWVNEVASINANNAIAHYSNFILERMPYQECANLGVDTIIRKAISTIKDEIFSKGGEFKIYGVENEEKIKEALDDKMRELDFFKVLSDLVVKSLTYGTAFLYLDFGGNGIDKPIYHNYSTLSAGSNALKRVSAVEPWGVGASKVEMSNILSEDYMKPRTWYVSGAGVVSDTRFLQMSFFETPDLIKPLFNYGGVSLCQLMKKYVRDSENIRSSLGDLFLRFRSMIIKTPSARMDVDKAKARAKAIANQKNNLGILLLSDSEEYQETITPITGLSQIQAQAFENMTISSQLPATKLLGISPSGFNSTGEHELNSYYDTIAGFQNSIVKPIIEAVAQKVLWNLGCDARVDFEFAPLKKMTEKEEAEIKQIEQNTKNARADLILKLYEGGLITAEQAFKISQDEELLPKELKLEIEAEPIDLPNIEGSF